MKKILYSLLLFAATATPVWAQNNLSGKKVLPAAPPSQPMELPQDGNRVRSVSPNTAFLLLDLKKKGIAGLSDDASVSKYALIRKNGQLYVNSIIVTKDGFSMERLTSYGVLSGSKFGGTHTALIPLAQLEAVAKLPGIHYLDIGNKAELTMDNARTATKVNQVHNGASLPQSYFGEGVVVGIIDIGFDYAHPNFYDSTGASGYRVKSVWEQNATTGTPPEGFAYGRELTTQAAIIAAKRDMPNQSHGSHVAGTAAGAGGGIGNVYTGVAPKSDIVLVSTNMYTPGILDGIDYIQEYAASVGKPCVINMSLGGQDGPHDGSSLFDKLCDSFFVGKGRILVGAAGNDGGDSIYLEKTYTATDTSVFTFIKFPKALNKNKGHSWADIWGEPGANFLVRPYLFNTNTGTIVASTPFYFAANFDSTYLFSLYDASMINPDTCFFKISAGIDINNSKPNIRLEVNNTMQQNDFIYVLLEVKGINTRTKMWLQGANSTTPIFTSFGYPFPAQSGSTSSTIGEIGGTGKNIISVGAYTSKNAWTAYNGSSQTAGFYVPEGAIAPFSGHGPTADGRTKPDITAPGNVIISSVSTYDTSYVESNKKVVAGVTVGAKTWYFGTMQGTSMSAPMVTGIMALWLDAYPLLTPDQAKTLLKSTSITDSYTGSISAAGHNTWGWGKINAWNGISTLLASIPPTPVLGATDTICAGASTILSAPAGYAAYEWSNGDTTQTIEVSEAGAYKVIVKNSEGFESKWSNPTHVIVLPAPPVPTVTVSADTLVSSANTGNQWYRNEILIPGATGKKYKPTESGDYKVMVTNAKGCASSSETVGFIPTGVAAIKNDKGIAVYPNPASDVVNIRFAQADKDVVLTVYDKLGKKVLVKTLGYVSGGQEEILQVGKLPAGTYNIQINGTNTNGSKQVSVVR